MEREVLISSPWYPVIGCVGMVQSQEKFRLDIRKHLFTEMVVKHWHRLPREVLDAPSLSSVSEAFGPCL